MTDYEALKAYGFSPAKAGEILLDVKRGDGYAARFLAMAKEKQTPKGNTDGSR